MVCFRFSLEPTEFVTPERALSLEPCLRHLRDRLEGASFQPEAAAGDSHRFVQGMEAECRRRGVTFHFGTRVGFGY